MDADQDRPRGRPWGRRFAAFLLVAIRHSSCWILRIFFSLLIFTAVLFTYLHLVGLPAYLADIFLDRMAHRGYHLQIGRLTLEIDRGLVARDVRLHASPVSPEPFLTAEALTVALDPVSLWRKRQIRPILSITDGTLKAHLGQGRMDAPEGSRSIIADRIHLRFSVSDRELLLRDFRARFLGIDFRGRGAAYLPPPSGPAVSADTPAIGNPLTAVLHALEAAPESLLNLVEQINAVSFNSPPSADFTFALYPGHPQNHHAALRLHNPAGGGVQHFDFDQFSLEAAWSNRILQLPEVHLRKGDGMLNASGWLNVPDQTVSLHLLQSIPLDAFLEILPVAARRQALQITDDFRFPLRLDLQIGPAPLASAAEAISGRLTFAKARLREVPVDQFDAAFSLTGKDIRIQQASLQMGSGPRASRLDLRDGHFSMDTRRFQSRVAGSIDPHVIKPLLTPGMRNIVDWFEIREPIEGDVVVGGTAGNPAIYCYGPVQATNFCIYGTEVQSLQGQLNITNEVMHITEAVLARPEGMARGDVHMAFSNQTLRLNVDSTLDLRATTEMLGPLVADFMKPFRFNGPGRVQVEGLLDYCNFSLNRLQGHVEAQRFGYDRWEADTAVFDLNVTGRRLGFTNAVATAYGGRFSGHGALYPVGNDLTWRYEADMATTGTRLNDLLSASYGKPMGELRGTLEGNTLIGGYIGPGTGPTVTGFGQGKVRDGLLFQTKLFSGLSAILSKIIPDFTLFAQTDATGSFAIRNSRVYSRDIEVQGTLFSVKASGHYSFAGDLNYRVEVQLLRGGPVAALVRLATRPVTRLLEFRLTGTFADPKWRPINLNPAELFD